MMSEPVRLYIYGLLAPLLGVLTFYGYVSNEAVPLWLALGGAVLGVGGTEVARRRVTPLSDPRNDKGEPLTP